ncbi:predicted protein [Chaetoceros tenuissimus]|uniref:Uncharacterized protein n=1 Tax=Chaetoceros tenuissimus TaxID=426638 RepID=A0AAD3CSD1_9STRA|nr:predicted protein [Chaetoceros tenuissimus]
MHSSDVMLKAEAVLQNARVQRMKAGENQKRTTNRRCKKNMKRIIHPTREDSIQSDIAVIKPNEGRRRLTVLKEDESFRNTRVDSNLATFERLPDLTGDYKSRRRARISKRRDGRIANLRKELESGALDSVFEQLDQLKLEPKGKQRQERRVSWNPELFDEFDEDSLCSEPTLRTKRSIQSILRSRAYSDAVEESYLVHNL